MQNKIVASSMLTSIRRIHWNLTPGVDGLPTNKSRHGVLSSEKLKLNTVFPLQTILEEVSEPLDSGAFASSRQSKQAIANWLCEVFTDHLLLFLTTALHHTSQKTHLLVRRLR